MIGNKAQKVMGMNRSKRRRLCGRDGCKQEGVGSPTRCLDHIEEEALKRKKSQS